MKKTPLDSDSPVDVGPQAIPRLIRRPWGLKAKVLLACASSLFMLFGVEAAYRCKLYFQLGDLPLGMAATYELFNESVTVPNEEFGYVVKPNRHLVGVRVTEGRPVLMYERETNELGNYEPPKQHYAEADFKILVFGDSFTAFYGDGTVWPTLLEERLQRRLGRTVCVLNFARDGYGVLEMLDLAKARVADFDPDLVLFCFISDDLDRARLAERSERDVVGQFLDEAVTTAWCQAALAGDDQGELLLKYNAQFERAKSEAQPINYLTIRHCFLYNRLVDEDPFSHLPKKAATTFRITIDSFAEDARFVAALDELQALKKKMLLIHLPEMVELQAADYQLTSRQERLLASLERSSGWKTVELLDVPVEGEVTSCFLFPHDLHPSASGLRYFAEIVDDALRKRNLP